MTGQLKGEHGCEILKAHVPNLAIVFGVLYKLIPPGAIVKNLVRPAKIRSTDKRVSGSLHKLVRNGRIDPVFRRSVRRRRKELSKTLPAKARLDYRVNDRIYILIFCIIDIYEAMLGAVIVADDGQTWG